IIEKDKEFLWALWRSLYGAKQKLGFVTPLYFWQDKIYNGLRILTPELYKWIECTRGQEFSQYLPDPGSKWQLEITYPKTENWFVNTPIFPHK
ncbi:MAG: hypothetical protein NTY09_01650, partial [bacterium]|nr:hypothetical protein [bacterium]